MDNIQIKATSAGIHQIRIKHPPGIYTDSIPEPWLTDYGFELHTEEVNQHLDLASEIRMHQMEIRKLKKWKHEMQVTQSHEWKQNFELLQDWRKKQRIPFNINWDHFEHLINSFPDKYDLWTVVFSDQVISICVCIKVTNDHVYYFLPGTQSDFREMSPMVLLITHMVEHYRNNGFRYFDLGQSSINGVKQKGLYLFKKRLGAKSLAKNSYLLDLTTRS
jgi:lipid II:glycine glycyltransferase (peptidoglycan interpeptide bridge formation enzyme)